MYYMNVLFINNTFEGTLKVCLWNVGNLASVLNFLTTSSTGYFGLHVHRGIILYSTLFSHDGG